MNNSIESKQNEKVNFIEDYVSSESTADAKAINLPHSNTANTKNVEQSQQIEVSKEKPSKQTEKVDMNTSEPPKPAINEPTNNVEDTMNEQNVSAPTKPIIPSTKPSKTETLQYNAQTVEQWRRKAQEYDELFQFTRKTLAQRDELNVRWKAETEKSRALQKLNQEMIDEKKQILSEFTKRQNEQDE